MPDLWPVDLASPTTLPPVALLLEQAHLLKEKMRGVIEGVVNTFREAGKIDHHFLIVAPSLENYAYRLFVVTHGRQFYPLQVHADVLSQTFLAQSEEEFEAHLKAIFASEESKRVIQSMLQEVIQPAA